MKTGSVAKKFGVDPNTITDWTDRFIEFFSGEAHPDEGKQRDYQPEDIIVLNTIRGFRGKNMAWDEIRVHLKEGERDSILPPEFVTIEGENAITVYAEMREMRVKLETAEAEIERLRQVAENERKRAEEQMKVERETNQAKIEQLIIEKTEWRMRYDGLKKRLGIVDDE